MGSYLLATPESLPILPIFTPGFEAEFGAEFEAEFGALGVRPQAPTELGGVREAGDWQARSLPYGGFWPSIALNSGGRWGLAMGLAVGAMGLAEADVRAAAGMFVPLAVDAPFFYDPSPPGSYDFTLHRRGQTAVDVPAPCQGWVAKTGFQGRNGGLASGKGWGNFVQINCSAVEPKGQRTWLLGHLARVAVQPGQTVQRGQSLGQQGCTGRCSGPHVHVQLHRLNGLHSRELGPRMVDRRQTEPLVRDYLAFVRQGGQQPFAAGSSQAGEESPRRRPDPDVALTIDLAGQDSRRQPIPPRQSKSSESVGLEFDPPAPVSQAFGRGGTSAARPHRVARLDLPPAGLRHRPVTIPAAIELGFESAVDRAARRPADLGELSFGAEGGGGMPAGREPVEFDPQVQQAFGQAAPLDKELATQPAARRLEQWFGRRGAIGAIAVGHAEGNLSTTGQETRLYRGHDDPGNGVRNIGFCSLQRPLWQDFDGDGQTSLAEADRTCLSLLQQQARRTQQGFGQQGFGQQVFGQQENRREIPLAAALNCVDLYNQSRAAGANCPDRYRAALAKGLEGERAIVWARVESFRRSDQTLSASGLFRICRRSDDRRHLSAWNCIASDQRRRVRAIGTVLQQPFQSGRFP